MNSCSLSDKRRGLRRLSLSHCARVPWGWCIVLSRRAHHLVEDAVLSVQYKGCRWLEDLFRCLPTRHGGWLQEEQPGETLLPHVCVQVGGQTVDLRSGYTQPVKQVSKHVQWFHPEETQWQNVQVWRLRSVVSHTAVIHHWGAGMHISMWWWPQSNIMMMKAASQQLTPHTRLFSLSRQFRRPRAGPASHEAADLPKRRCPSGLCCGGLRRHLLLHLQRLPAAHRRVPLRSYSGPRWVQNFYMNPRLLVWQTTIKIFLKRLVCSFWSQTRDQADQLHMRAQQVFSSQASLQLFTSFFSPVV